MTPLAVCRFAHFMAAMLAFGSSASLRLYAPADLRRALSPRVRRLAIAASLVALATAIIWLALETASMADDWAAAADPGAIAAVLTDTEFGQAWIAHLVLAAALAGAAIFTPRDQWGAVTLLSGFMLASLALVGHAAMQAGFEGVLHRANHAVHLLTTGAWLGGLLPFALFLDACGANMLRNDAIAAMRRFSFWGQFVVAAIVATGIVNIALISGKAPLPATTPYRALLDVKIGVVAVMIAFALFNRFELSSRLERNGSAVAVLRMTCMAEVALGTIAVALVSLFGLLDPA